MISGCCRINNKKPSQISQPQVDPECTLTKPFYRSGNLPFSCECSSFLTVCSSERTRRAQCYSAGSLNVAVCAKTTVNREVLVSDDYIS